MTKEFDYVKRECGECTACCEGWLSGTAHGSRFYPNSPCHYLDGCNGCSIYKDRPEICQQFECLWKQTNQIPGWLKPSRCGAILYQRSYYDKDGKYGEPGETIRWWSMVECGKQLDSAVLAWTIHQTKHAGINLHYTVNRQNYYLGDDNFMKFGDEGALFTEDEPDA